MWKGLRREDEGGGEESIKLMACLYGCQNLSYSHFIIVFQVKIPRGKAIMCVSLSTFSLLEYPLRDRQNGNNPCS